MRPPQVKHFADLTPDDFRKHPVWSWYEVDDELVMPVQDENVLPDGYDYVFVRSDLTLGDGTPLEGVVSIVIDEKEVYLIEFFVADAICEFSLATYRRFRTGEEIAGLIQCMQKPLDCIFPVKYQTAYAYPDGSPISGVIELSGSGLSE